MSEHEVRATHQHSARNAVAATHQHSARNAVAATHQLSPRSEDARSFSWLLNTFVDQTAGVTDTVAVSSDGLLMAMSTTLERAHAEQVGAIISGLVSLAHGASSCFAFDGLERIIVAMPRGLLLVGSISDGSAIGVVARKGCDIGTVGYQMTLLVERVGALLTPGLIAELRQELLAR